LFRQIRVGRNGRPFVMYKFRSMVPDAEARKAAFMALNEMTDGILFKIRKDPRVTRVGRVCRKLSLDELPQFVNVLRGEMSLVGPRPPVPSEVALYDPADRRRLAAVPGITGLWQISGRSNIDFRGQVQLDIKYIERQTLGLDLEILARTIPAVLSGKGAS
jgi:lipopolysaccharide/colanic/teichoic acid biosynthesis glycosyltransferase